MKEDLSTITVINLRIKCTNNKLHQPENFFIIPTSKFRDIILTFTQINIKISRLPIKVKYKNQVLVLAKQVLITINLI